MRVLVTGASGQLGAYVVRELVAAGDDVVAWTNAWQGDLFGVKAQPIDITNRNAVSRAFAEAKPDAVAHLAAMSSMAEAHRHPDRAEAVNVDATAHLCELAETHGARVVYASTDLVFDGEKGWYTPGDETRPLSVYGRTKRDGELPVLLSSHGLVLRFSLLVGPTLVGQPKFFEQLETALRSGNTFTLFDDEWRTPLSATTASQAVAHALRTDHHGVMHSGGRDRLTRWEMGQLFAKALQLDTSNVVVTSRTAMSAAEPRPRDTSLDSAVWRQAFPQIEWPGYEESLRRMRAEQ